MAISALVFSGVLMRPFVEVTEIIDISINTITISLCIVATLFLRYASPDRFPISAFINIGLTYFFSLCTLGFLAVDIAFTRYNEVTEDSIEQEEFLTAMRTVWNIVYFGNIICGTVVNKFL